MKLRHLLLSSVTALGLTVGSLAQDGSNTSDAQTQAECMQACFEQYQENLEACRSACWVCDVWIVFCWSGHHDEDCLADCEAEAKLVWEACKADCEG